MPDKGNLNIDDDAFNKLQKGPNWKAMLKRKPIAGEGVKRVRLPIETDDTRPVQSTETETQESELMTAATAGALLQQQRPKTEESDKKDQQKQDKKQEKGQEATSQQQQSQMQARESLGPNAQSPLHGRGKRRPKMEDKSTLQSVTSPVKKEGWSAFSKLVFGEALVGGTAAGLIYFLT